MIIAREKECQWLQRFAQFNRLVAVTGIRGIGKTTLLREWLNGKSGRVKWVIAERYRPLNAILGRPDSSVEAALQSTAVSWEEQTFVIWDDIHLLNSSTRHTLLSFLKSTPGACTHVVISDEDLGEAIGPEIPRLHLQPFQINETREFLQALMGGENIGDVEQAQKATAGVPLMLNLWAQNCTKWNYVRETLLADLSAGAERVLCVCSLLDRALAIQDFHLQDVVAPLDELKRKFLVECDNDRLHVPRPVQALVVQGLSESLRKQYERDVLTVLENSENYDTLEFLIHALHAGDVRAVAKILPQVSLAQLERLRSSELAAICKLMGAIASQFNPKEQIAMARLRVHALWICGQRDQAIELGTSVLATLDSQGLTETDQFLILEVITLLNRSDRRELATQLVQKFLRCTAEPVFSLLKVEQMFSWIQSDTSRAIKGFEELLKSARLQSPNDPWSLLTAAQAQFQLGRAYGLLDQFNESETAYQKSESNYIKLDRPYFAAVSLLNQAWVALHRRAHATARERCSRLKILAERFGYDYVMAGVYIIEATLHRLDLEGGPALDKIEAAHVKLPSTSPRAARVDAQAEKIRILAQMGLYERAQKQVAQIAQVLAEQAEILQLDCHLFDTLDDDLLEKWELLPGEDEAFWCYHLERGREKLTDEARAQLQQTRWGKLALVQAEILGSLREQDTERVWQGLAQLEKLLQQIPEARPERVAGFLLEAQLTENEQKRADLLERAEVELMRWSADPILKAPLQAWQQGIQSRQNITSNSLWLKSRPVDCERWQCWWGPLQTRSNAQFTVTTSHGILPCHQLDAIDTRHGIVAIEPLGEVYYQGDILPEFHGKPLLRQFLVAILNAGLDGLAKQTLASLVWGETYSPTVHDTRIYTSIQRIRGLLGEDLIQTWNHGYRVNPAIEFTLVQSSQGGGLRQNRIQSLILQALRNFKQNGKVWVSRADLVEVTVSSEASVKRALSQLLCQSLIIREGHGPAVKYAIC